MKQTNLSLNEEDLLILAAIRQQFGIDNTAAIRIALRKFAKFEGIVIDKRPLEQVVEQRSKTFRTYIGMHDEDGSGVVYVEEAGAHFELPSTDLLRTKYEWGYLGSGPNNLAKSLLAYEFADMSMAVRYFQKFLEMIVGKLPGTSDEKLIEQWRITSIQIRNWVRHTDKPTETKSDKGEASNVDTDLEAVR